MLRPAMISAVILLLLISACSSPDPAAPTGRVAAATVGAATNTPAPTETPEPTETIAPTMTPTATTEPPDTPEPTPDPTAAAAAEAAGALVAAGLPSSAAGAGEMLAGGWRVVTDEETGVREIYNGTGQVVRTWDEVLGEWREVLSLEELQARVAAEVQVDRTYTPGKVNILWGTNTPALETTNQELEQIAQDPALCYVENQSGWWGERAEMRLREDSAYQTLFFAATLVEQTLGELDPDDWPATAPHLQRYRGMSAQEVMADWIQNGYEAWLPAIVEVGDEHFGLGEVQANLAHVTWDVTVGFDDEDYRYDPQLVDGVLYADWSSHGFVPTPEGLTIVMKTYFTTGEDEHVALAKLPLADIFSRWKIAARYGPVPVTAFNNYVNRGRISDNEQKEHRDLAVRTTPFTVVNLD